MGIEATIKKTEDILKKILIIPSYQRPYRWGTKSVLQLMTDVQNSLEAGKKEYRIGTCIFYKDKINNPTALEIIDGQQRLTTIILILLSCRSHLKDHTNSNASKIETNLDLRAINTIKFKSNSVTTIKNNYSFINDWLETNTNDHGKKMSGYLLESCRFLEIIVDDLSEAFQMFDTQNGRGKSLEVYNLLKAYHIRAMEQNTQEEKIRCDQNWERAIQYDATPDIQTDPNVDILRQLFNEQLFKSRVWCRNESAKMFTKDDIGEFKGFTIDKNHPINYPFQNPYLLQYLTEKFYNNVLAGTIGTQSRFESGESEHVNPFVNINQVIINGKSFFEYVETYVDIYKKMFIELGTYQLSEFKKFYYQYCLTYSIDDNKWNDAKIRTDSFRRKIGQARRVGDTYLREIYKSLCLVLFDKFGERPFLKYYKTLYRLIYRCRLQNGAIRLSTAMDYPRQFFVIISSAKNTVDLMQLDKFALIDKDEKLNHEDTIESEAIRNFIKGKSNE